MRLSNGALVVCKSLAFDDLQGHHRTIPSIQNEQTSPTLNNAERASDQPDLIEAMWRETRILSQMSHPHIIRYLHASRHGTEMRIFMEHANAGTLATAIRNHRGRPFAHSSIHRWMHQLASALRHVHSHGVCLALVVPMSPCGSMHAPAHHMPIILSLCRLHGHAHALSTQVLHRDLKAANVFLTTTDGELGDVDDSSCNVKLGDFGVARPLSTFTHFANTMVGTPYYLAPEVLASAPYAFSADCWSLGVILFELLTLSRPFESPHLGALVRMVERGEMNMAALDRCPHSAAFRRLAGPQALLHPDPTERMRLEELLEELGR